MLLTDDIVPVLILHHSLQIGVIAAWLVHLVRNPSPLLGCTVLNALLHDIGCKLVLGVNQQLAGNMGDDLGPILRWSMLDDMLRDVVAKLVVDQGLGVSVNFGQDGLLVVLVSIFQDSLDDSAGVRMLCKLSDPSFERVHDKSDRVTRNHLDNLLHDMVSVLVLQNLDDFRLQLLRKLGLLLDENVIKCLKYSISLGSAYLGRLGDATNLLHNSASIHLDREVDHLSLHLVGQNLLLDLTSVLKQLLDDVIAKYILHESNCVWTDLGKHLVLLIAIGRFKLLLNEARAMLVTRKLHDVPVDFLNMKSEHCFYSRQLRHSYLELPALLLSFLLHDLLGNPKLLQKGAAGLGDGIMFSA